MTKPIKINKIRVWLLQLPRFQKRLLILVNDFALLCLALFAAFTLRFGTILIPQGVGQALVFFSAPLIGIVCLRYVGTYRRIARHSGRSGTRRVMAGITLNIMIWTLFVYLVDIDIKAIHGVPRSVIVIYWALSILMVWTNREFVSWYLNRTERPATEDTLSGNDVALRKKILIWGYSEMALQVAQHLRRSREYDPVGIVDEDSSLHFLKADDIKIFPPDHLETLIPAEQIKEVFLDSEIVSREKRLEVVQLFEATPVVLKVLPSIQDIASGKVSIDRIRKIKVEDLLGRDAIPPFDDLLKDSVLDKVIMVTGAGGTIGSELVRQLVALKPKKLILLELSEVALYEISSEVDKLVISLIRKGKIDGPNSAPEIMSVIGSVCDADAVQYVIKENSVQIVYHAAAYKHVPLVEFNPAAGLRNNTFGTRTIAAVAKECAVERFVFISTDKAVRPTNIMGASKRLAEMVLQGMAAEKDCQTIFCMVRFGNVLDSSGSVVPKFREQINNGGPVSVTHPDIIRYFMSISEAASLVIQAGTMAEAGAVFVLDMGEPVKIIDLAHTMIQLAGQRIKDENNPDGDIAIEYTGLRSGEKLYEELLIGGKTSPTRHPRILQLDEPFMSLDELALHLDELKKHMEKRDTSGIRKVLGETVEGYQVYPNSS